MLKDKLPKIITDTLPGPKAEAILQRRKAARAQRDSLRLSVRYRQSPGGNDSGRGRKSFPGLDRGRRSAQRRARASPN